MVSKGDKGRLVEGPWRMTITLNEINESIKPMEINFQHTFRNGNKNRDSLAKLRVHRTAMCVYIYTHVYIANALIFFPLYVLFFLKL